MNPDVDCDDLPEIFVRRLLRLGPEVRVWSRTDALRRAEQQARSRKSRPSRLNAGERDETKEGAR